ncbi:hypothetical protein ACSSVZ_004033 [Amorphus sp. MBR-141]
MRCAHRLRAGGLRPAGSRPLAGARQRIPFPAPAPPQKLRSSPRRRGSRAPGSGVGGSAAPPPPSSWRPGTPAPWGGRSVRSQPCRRARARRPDSVMPQRSPISRSDPSPASNAAFAAAQSGSNRRAPSSIASCPVCGEPKKARRSAPWGVLICSRRVAPRPGSARAACYRSAHASSLRSPLRGRGLRPARGRALAGAVRRVRARFPPAPAQHTAHSCEGRNPGRFIPLTPGRSVPRLREGGLRPAGGRPLAGALRQGPFPGPTPAQTSAHPRESGDPGPHTRPQPKCPETPDPRRRPPAATLRRCLNPTGPASRCQGFFS